MNSKVKAFTIVELIIVLCIITILMGVGYVSFVSVREVVQNRQDDISINSIDLMVTETVTDMTRTGTVGVYPREWTYNGLVGRHSSCGLWLAIEDHNVFTIVNGVTIVSQERSKCTDTGDLRANSVLMYYWIERNSSHKHRISEMRHEVIPLTVQGQTEQVLLPLSSRGKPIYISPAAGTVIDGISYGPTNADKGGTYPFSMILSD
jgi:type II secretory pathway pseudopilin PulG